MKNTINYLIPAFALMSLPLAHAQISFDDGAVGDSNWTSANNWNPNGVPGSGNTITIGSGFTADYDVGGNLPGSTTLIVDGTLSIVSGGVLRTLGADITVSSTGELTAADTGRFYDMNNATVTFQDGAQFTQGVWENKGTNTFNFELGTTGFNTLTPSRLNVSGGAGNISNATYNADLGGASYTGGSQILTLVDYGTDTHGISNANFQNATLTITDTGTNAARLYWNDTEEAIMLGINQTVTWDGGGGDGNWDTASNWDAPDNKAPIANDTLVINNGDTVNFTANGNLAGNLTISLEGSTLNKSGTGAIRLNGATINVDSTSALTGGFWDLNNATLNFEDGAQFTATNWEQKGANVFDFELSNTGFTALTPGSFNQNGATTTNYRADLASYSGATQDVTLVDFGSSSLDNNTFTGGGQYTLSIDNTGTNAARLYYDDATDAVKLSINETVTWTGGGANDSLTTAANWDAPDNKAPINNDTLVINNGDTVQHTGNLPSNLTISLAASTLDNTGLGAIRLNDATINVDAASTLSGAFWDLDGASIVFEDGAQANMANWEQKDINSFTYVLGASDFTTLTPGDFRIGNGSLTGNIANATYIADFSNFAYSLGSYSITLMDFGSDGTGGGGMTDALFQTATFDYINIGALGIENEVFAWDAALDTITLTFDITAVPEPSSTALLGLGGLALMLRRKRS